MPLFDWDGRFAQGDMSSLIRDHIAEAHFMNLDGRLLVERMRQIPEYEQAFQELYGSEASYGRTLDAVGAFVATLNSQGNPYIDHVGGDANALSDSAKAGLKLFEGKAGCAQCHSGELLSDGELYLFEPLLGMPIQGHVVATRSGHQSNIELVRKLRKVYGKRFKGQKGQAAKAEPRFDIKAILNALPHRYPMLLIDRVLEVEPGKRVRAVKNVSINEPHFQGHFPGQPVMPGVLILEAMAQAGGFLLLNEQINPATKLVYFSAIDKARFRQAVVPGDQLILEIELLRIRLSTAKMAGRAFVDGKLVAEAELMATIVDREG
ncbi:MAG: 3-hydroxyacyl-ACP dehydratase FabZ [Candidatus Marinimicrobia bacterium]|nr:3-hydroxyacyl-ACP dehydratase FabZ [Candidatus Neomarinimicrobiota bacterium]